MLGLCGCLAGVQAQTIPVELEVGKAGAVPSGRAARGGRQRQVLRAADADGQEIVILAAPRASPRCMSDGRWTAHRLCVQSRAGGARRANVRRGRGCSRAFRRPGACTSAAVSSSKATICPTRTAPASRALAERYPSVLDLTGQVGWDRMVLLDVQVVEILTSRLREFGLKWDGLTQGGVNVGWPGTVAPRGVWSGPANRRSPRTALFPTRPAISASMRCCRRAWPCWRSAASGHAGPAPAAGAQRRQRDLSGWRRIASMCPRTPMAETPR